MFAVVSLAGRRRRGGRSRLRRAALGLAMAGGAVVGGGSGAAQSATAPPGGTFTTLKSPLTRSVDITKPVPNCPVGPVGLLDDGTSFYVSDVCNGITYRYALGATVPAQLENSAKNGLTDGLAISHGVYYGIAGVDQSIVKSGIYVFDPTTLALKNEVIAAPCHDTRALAADPASSDFFVSGDCGVFRLGGVGSAKPTLKELAAGNFDGLTVVGDGGAFWVANVQQGVNEYSSTGKLLASVPMGVGPDGVALASTAAPASIAGNLFVNGNDGSITMVDVHGNHTLTTVASGGSRGDFVTVGPDGYLYATQSDRVEQVQPAIFAPTEVPSTGGGISLVWIILGLLLLALLVLLFLLWRRRRKQERAQQADPATV